MCTTHISLEEVHRNYWQRQPTRQPVISVPVATAAPYFYVHKIPNKKLLPIFISLKWPENRKDEGTESSISISHPAHKLLYCFLNINDLVKSKHFRFLANHFSKDASYFPQKSHYRGRTSNKGINNRLSQPSRQLSIQNVMIIVFFPQLKSTQRCITPASSLSPTLHRCAWWFWLIFRYVTSCGFNRSVIFMDLGFLFFFIWLLFCS